MKRHLKERRVGPAKPRTDQRGVGDAKCRPVSADDHVDVPVTRQRGRRTDDRLAVVDGGPTSPAAAAVGADRSTRPPGVGVDCRRRVAAAGGHSDRVVAAVSARVGDGGVRRRVDGRVERQRNAVDRVHAADEPSPDVDERQARLSDFRLSADPHQRQRAGR